MSTIRSVFLWRSTALSPFASLNCTAEETFYFLLQGHCYKTPQQTFGIGLRRALCTLREQRNSSSAAGKSHEQLFWYFCLHYKASNCIRMHPLVIFEALLPIPHAFSKHMVWKSYWRESGDILRFIVTRFLSFWFFYWLELSRAQIKPADFHLCIYHFNFFSVLRSDLFVFIWHSLWHMVATNIVI